MKLQEEAAVVEVEEKEAGVEGPVLDARFHIREGEITAAKLAAVIRFSSSNHETRLRWRRRNLSVS